jgi:ribosomal subunit interface protein
MALRVSGKNLEIGAALRSHVLSRLASSTAKYFDGGVSGHVTIGPEGSGYKTECTLHLASGILLTAEGEAQEPYASFDKTADRIDKRLRRYKQRLKEHHGAGGGGDSGAPTTEMASYVIEAPDAEAEETASFSPVIVAESAVLLKTMSVAAAVAELDLTNAPVVVFRHATEGRLNLVYRRPDGNIGWIDPEGRPPRR